MLSGTFSSLARRNKFVRSLAFQAITESSFPSMHPLALPLADLTRKIQPNHVVWSQECEAAFQRLKAALCASPILTSPNFQKEFIVQMDASDRGVGAVLSQLDNQGNDKPVAFYSRELLPREERYSVIEKECLAIKSAVQTFHPYLMGQKFRMQTDHRSLEWLNSVKDFLS